MGAAQVRASPAAILSLVQKRAPPPPPPAVESNVFRKRKFDVRLDKCWGGTSSGGQATADRYPGGAIHLTKSQCAEYVRKFMMADSTLHHVYNTPWALPCTVLSRSWSILRDLGWAGSNLGSVSHVTGGGRGEGRNGSLGPSA